MILNLKLSLKSKLLLVLLYYSPILTNVRVGLNFVHK
nr:MAG TPA: Rap-phr extracellular signaling [Crassvirales sp.]